MGTFLILAGLGFWLGLKIQSRIGAAFLCLSAATSLHAILSTVPRLLDNSVYGRRLAGLLSHVGERSSFSLFEMMAFALAGLSIALLLHSVSEDRKPRRKLARRKRRKLRPAAKLRHDPC